MAKNSTHEFLTLAETAEYLRMSPKTLRNKRTLGDAPVAHKFGGRVLFLRSDIDDNVKSRRETPSPGGSRDRC